ncbi:DEAD/DEAH box helicase [Nocardia sp. NPDC052254]|uniref:DEAD/DEAH box helicase n=1 Tax=Nocardia sp. NPDC052254 TaxID=3155681 RepID=UPI003437ECD9
MPEAGRKGPGFAALGLPVELVQALRRAGVETAFPIQTATIPDVVAGRDVLGRAATGSGKTLAFGLPMLMRLRRGASAPRRPRALVLAPTRELALQIEATLDDPAVALGLRVAAAVGGIPIKRQADRLGRGVDLLVATPGRLTDLIGQGALALDAVATVAIDEADHMAQLGFIDQVRAVLDLLPADCRHLLFSATLDEAVDALVRDYLDDPVRHDVGTGPGEPAGAEAAVTPATAEGDGAQADTGGRTPAPAHPESVAHHLLRVRAADKRAVITEIAARPGRTLLFARTQYGADKLARRLRESGVAAVVLHGGLTQNQRIRTLAAFSDGSAPVLVATDVAARGIHVDDITLVVHADPAADAKDYLHRSGRTGRAGASGTVVTVVTDAGDDAAAVLRAAGVPARESRVRPGDPALIAITGARRPTGRPAANPIAAPTAAPDTPGNPRAQSRRPHTPARRSKRRAN